MYEFGILQLLEAWGAFFLPDIGNEWLTAICGFCNSILFLVGQFLIACGSGFTFQQGKRLLKPEPAPASSDNPAPKQKPLESIRIALGLPKCILLNIFTVPLSLLAIWAEYVGVEGSSETVYSLLRKRLALESLFASSSSWLHGISFLGCALIAVVYIVLIGTVTIRFLRAFADLLSSKNETKAKANAERESRFKNPEFIKAFFEDRQKRREKIWLLLGTLRKDILKYGPKIIKDILWWALLGFTVWLDQQSDAGVISDIVEKLPRIIEVAIPWEVLQESPTDLIGIAHHFLIVAVCLLFISMLFVLVLSLAYMILWRAEGCKNVGITIEKVFRHLWHGIKTIFDSFIEKWPDIFKLLVIAFIGTILYIIGSNVLIFVEMLAQTLKELFPPTTEQLVELVPYVLALVALLTALASGVTFLFELCRFFWAVGRCAKWKLIGKKGEGQEEKTKALWSWLRRTRSARHNAALTVFVIALFAAISYIVYVYISLNNPNNDFTLLQYTPNQILQAAGFFLTLVLGVGTIVLALLGAFGLIGAFLAAVWKFFTAKWNQKVADPGSKQAEIGDGRSLVATLMTGLKKLLETFLRVLVGFRNDIQKNQAIYLACALASVASGLNTFFGLNEFLKDEGNPIPTICAVTIAAAVQFAVLIFGTKAGECVRERFHLRKANTRTHAPWASYFAAMVFFMLISSGFAYSNMFGFYARSVGLQEQVMDQVRSKADETMKVSSRIKAVVKQYNDNRQEMLKLLDEYDEAVERYYNDTFAALRREAGEEPSDIYVKKNRRDAYKNNVKDRPDVVASLKSLLQMDYTDFGEETQVQAKRYDHYYGEVNTVSYTTHCIVVQVDSERKIVAGSAINEAKLATQVLIDAKPVKRTRDFSDIGRVLDPDSQKQSIVVHTRIVPNADLYDSIDEVLNLYTELCKIVLTDSADSVNGVQLSMPTGFNRWKSNENSFVDSYHSVGVNSDRLKQIIILIRNLLDQNRRIDSVRGNLLNLYYDIDELEGIDDTVDGLPHLIDLYLTNENEEGTTDEQSPQKSELAQEMTKVHNYLSRLKKVSHCLLPVESNDNNAYDAKLDKYERYAESLITKDFKISRDVLWRGFFGINRDEGITSHYSAQYFSVIFLFICIAIDSLPFWSGLLLYKSIYQFYPHREEEKKKVWSGLLLYKFIYQFCPHREEEKKKDGKNEEAEPIIRGALDMEALLIDYFRLPDDEPGRVKKLDEIQQILFEKDGSIPFPLDEKGEKGGMDEKAIRCWLECYVKEEGIRLPSDNRQEQGNLPQSQKHEEEAPAVDKSPVQPDNQTAV